MNDLSYFVYGNIPGAGKGWTLAVLATGRHDADQYIKAVHRGGKFQNAIIGGGTVKADCGAVTQAAQTLLRSRQLEAPPRN